MRIHTLLGTSAGTALAVLTLGACRPNQATVTTGTSASTAVSSGSTASSGSGAGSGSGSAHACKTSQLSMRAANGPTDGGTSSVVITLTNHGSASCALDGFAGVNMNTGGGVDAVPRNGAKFEAVTLVPGSSSSFAIWYESQTPNTQNGNNVTNLTVTPPNDTHSATVSWPGSGLTTSAGGQSLWLDPIGETAPDPLGTTG